MLSDCPNMLQILVECVEATELYRPTGLLFKSAMVYFIYHLFALWERNMLTLVVFNYFQET